MDKWPNFFIVGTTRGGTTSLHNYLKQHPDIFMSPEKEPKFFLSPKLQKMQLHARITNKKHYLKLFKNANNEKIIGEASPQYLFDPKAPELIHYQAPDSRILISLRDPIEKCFSMFLMQKRDGRLKDSFLEEINKKIELKKSSAYLLRLETGFYYEDVKRYLDIFGKNQVKIIIFEELIKNIDATIKEVLDFLGVENKYFEFKPEVYNPYKKELSPLTFVVVKYLRNKTFLLHKYVPSKVRQLVTDNMLYKKAKKPEMTEEERLKLIEYFREDVQKLETLLGRKLPWKNFHN